MLYCEVFPGSVLKHGELLYLKMTGDESLFLLSSGFPRAELKPNDEVAVVISYRELLNFFSKLANHYRFIDRVRKINDGTGRSNFSAEAVFHEEAPHEIGPIGLG